MAALGIPEDMPEQAMPCDMKDGASNYTVRSEDGVAEIQVQLKNKAFWLVSHRTSTLAKNGPSMCLLDTTA